MKKTINSNLIKLMKIKTFKKITFLLEIHIAKIFLILIKNT